MRKGERKVAYNERKAKGENSGAIRKRKWRSGKKSMAKDGHEIYQQKSVKAA